MYKVRRTTPEVRVEMAPLIDVVFLLLTFFVFAMLMMVRAQVLDITLPSLGAGRPAENATAVTISIAADGGTFVDGDAVDRDSLIGAIRAKIEQAPGAKINLAADTASSAGDLLKIVDLLSKNGYGNFQLFGTPEAPAGTAGDQPVAPAAGGE
ncbi:MAG: biopolymer transporter ExbD [Phycisphaerales bacterium]|nr:biopolymer transporter ExbD [Phycisphaerales bacterium]